MRIDETEPNERSTSNLKHQKLDKQKLSSRKHYGKGCVNGEKVIHTHFSFLYKKILYKKMSLKNQKTE